MSTGEVPVGNLYKECLLGCIDCSIQVNNDTFLVPYVLEVHDFWESYKIVTDYYLSSNNIRLYFEPENFLNLKGDQTVKIGKITVMPSYDALAMYVEYPLPMFNLSIMEIKYIGKDDGWYFFNATFRINNAGIIVDYSFDKFGQKYKLSEIFVPIYLLTIKEPYSYEDIRIVRRINETHCLVATPTDTGFGSGFKDVYLEPKHEYIASYASTGDTFWLEIKVKHWYVTNNTLVFVTPWKYEVKVSNPSK